MPLLVSHVSEVVVPTGQARVRLATCVEVDVCLHPPRHGEDGTEESMSTRRDMPSAQL